MKVLLAHGYYLHEDAREQGIMKPYPPLGLLYIAAWLEQHGVENAVFDTTFSTKAQFQAQLLSDPPRILALYVNLMTKLNVLETIAFVRAQALLRDTRVVLGGPDVTYNVQEYLDAGADLIVIGEGEQSMLELAQAALAQDAVDPLAQFGHIPGLAFLLPDGTPHRTAPREKMRDIDVLPLPAREKIDLQLYLDAWKKAHGHNAINLSTQRGCPYTCKWCSTAVYGQSYRRRSPELVVEEIAWLKARYDFDLIWFVDDVFTVSHKWLRAFAEALRARQLEIRYECITRADRLNEESMDLLRESGCFRVWIGAESGSQRILDAMDRRVQATQVRDMIRLARAKGIESGTFIMLGYPGETEADIADTLEHLRASNPDHFTITVAYPIKGTGLYESVADRLKPAKPWTRRSDRELDFERSYSRQYYNFAVKWIVNTMHHQRSEKNIFRLKALAARIGMYYQRLL